MRLHLTRELPRTSNRTLNCSNHLQKLHANPGEGIHSTNDIKYRQIRADRDAAGHLEQLSISKSPHHRWTRTCESLLRIDVHTARDQSDQKSHQDHPWQAIIKETLTKVSGP